MTQTVSQTPESSPAPEEAPPPPARSGPFLRFLQWVASANTVTVTVLAVVLALLVGAVLIVLGNEQVTAEYGYFFATPGTVLADSWRLVADAYTNLFEGAIVDPSAVSGAIDGTNSWTRIFAPISATLIYTAPLAFTGLAVALAFRSGLFNIGAQGAVVMGAIGGGLVGFEVSLPPVLHLIAALLGAVIGGALWSSIAGILKARTGAHEVIVTIMLNYVALYFLQWIITQKGVHDPTRSDAISKKVAGNARLPLAGTGDLRIDLGIVLALLATVGVAWLLTRSTLGFALRAVGANPAAARTAGMSVGRTYVLAMVLSGALAGLGGGLLVMGTAQVGASFALTGQVGGTIGFDGITVALLGRAKPWGVFVSALLFGALHAGGNHLQVASHISIDLVTVIQAVIVIFVAAPALVRAIFRLRASRSAGGASLARGW